MLTKALNHLAMQIVYILVAVVLVSHYVEPYINL